MSIHEEGIIELESLNLLNSDHESDYDRITWLAAELCDSHASLVTFLGKEKQYIKSNFGIEIKETPIIDSFCAHTIREHRRILVIEDATKDERFNNNPLVLGNPNIVFYAGAALISKTGNALGALCVIDFKPRKLSKKQEKALQALAEQVVQLIELKRNQLIIEQKEKQLKQESDVLNNILKSTQVGTWEWNVQTGELKVNERWAEIAGYQLSELLPTSIETWYKILRPEDRHISENGLAACFSQKQEFFDVECRLIHKNGKDIWINDRGKVVSWTNDGKPLMMMGTHTDISEKKLAELQFQTITNNIPGVVYRYNLKPDGSDILSFVSEGASNLWGFSVKEIVENNQLVWQCYDKNDLGGYLESIKNSAKYLTIWECEWRFNHPDGSMRWHKSTGKPSFEFDGTIVWDCITLDITAEKLAQAALAESEQKFVLMFDKVAHLSVQGYKQDGTIVFWNQANETLFGYTREEAIGAKIWDLVIPAHDVGNFKSELINNISNEQHSATEMLMKRKDGTLIPIFSNQTVLKRIGNDAELFSINIDLTEQKKASETIEKARADLQFKVNEQTCLFQIAHLINQEYHTKELLEKAVELISAGLQKLENCIVQIKFEDKVYFSKRHSRSNPLLKIIKHSLAGKPFEISIFCNTSSSSSLEKVDKLSNDVKIFVETVVETLLLGIDQIDAKQNLVKSEHRLTTILNTEPECVKVVSKDGRLLSMNQAGLRMIESDNAESLFGQLITNLVHPKDVATYKKLHQLALSGEKGEARFRIITMKGNLMWMESHSVPMRDENGKIDSVLSVTSDITQKIKTEEELNQTRKTQEALINVTSDLIWSIDTKFRVVAANKAFKNFVKSMNGKQINEGESILVGDFSISVLQNWKEYYKRTLAGESFSIQERFYNNESKSNSTGIFSFYPIRNDLDIITGAACYARDITELVSQKDKIESAKAELDKIMTSSMDMICTLDVKGYFKKVSSASERILGYKPEELEGMFYRDLIHPDSLDLTDKIAKEIIAGKEIPNIENQYIRKDGSVVTLFWTVKWDEESQLVYCVARDATQMKEAESKIRLNESLMNEAQKLAKMGSWNFDFRTDKVTWTEHLYDVFDVDKDTFKETHGSFISLVDEDDRERVMKTSRDAQQNGESFQITYKITTPKGEKRIIEEFGYCEKDSDGKILRLFGTAQDVTERKKAEENIELMLNNTEETFILIDTDLNIMSFNKQFDVNYEKIFKKKIKIGDSILNLTQPERLEMLKKLYERVFKGHREESIIQVNFGNEPKIYRNIYNPAKDTSGKIIGAFVTSMDITERENATKEVLKINERYEYVTKATSDAIWDYDIVNQELYWGEGFNSLFGYQTHRIKENYGFWEKCVHPEDKESVNQFVANKLNSGDNTWQQEYRFLKADGTYAFILDKAYLIRDNHGVPLRIIGAMQDLTSAKKEEQMLKLMQSVIANTTDAVLITEAGPFDSPGPKIIYANEAFTKLTGYSIDEIIGQSPRMLQGPKTDLAELKEFSRKIRSWEPAELTTINYKKNGEEFWIHVSVTPVTNEKGWFTHWIAIERDVTESKINELQTKLHAQLSSIFNETEELIPTLKKALKYIANLGDFDTAEFWKYSKDDDNLKLYSTYASNLHFQNFFTLSSEFVEFSIGQSLPGMIWQNKLIVVWDDIEQNEDFLRRAFAQQVGLKSTFGIPIFSESEFLGVLILNASRNLSTEKNNLKVFYGLKTFLGEEIKRKMQEEEMYLLFHSAPEILAVAKPNGYFNKVNPALCKLLGYSELELMSKPFRSFLHPDDINKSLIEFNETMDGYRISNNFINRYLTKDGQCRWIAWSSSKPFGQDKFVFAYGRDVTEFINLQKMLDNATQLSRVGAWEFNLRTKEIYWSSITRQIHEVDENFELTRESTIAFFHPNHRASAIDSMRQALESGITFDLEVLIITAKGNERWIRIIGNIEYLNGESVKLFGSFQDIHQRKVAEIQTVKLFEERNSILESIGDGFVTIDKNWNFTYLNHKAESILTTTRDVLLGKNVWEMFPDAFETEFHKRFISCFDTKQSQHFEAFYNGLGIWVDMSVYPTDDGISIFFKDISEKKQIEESIRQSNERFEKVTLATNDAIWDLDLIRNSLYWGGGYKTTFGHQITSQENKPETWSKLIHAKDRKRVIQSVENVLKNPSVFNWESEYRYQKANGEYAYIVDRGVIIREINGKAIRMVGAMSDITHRKLTEEHLQKLNKQLERQTNELAVSNAELEQFAYVASHDLQEPLRMITSFLAQLEKKYAYQLDDKANQYIHYAVDGAKRMRQIILDLLDFSRVGKFNENLEMVALNEVLNEVKQLIAKSIYESGATIQADNLPMVSAFRSPMVQVFQNVISNAIKYRNADQKLLIQIKSVEKEKFWEISISDNGIGIESDYFDKIFVIFQRLHNKDEYSGTGMGLSIVKKIIENFGGKIWVESQIGKGSTFTFTIPKITNE